MDYRVCIFLIGVVLGHGAFFTYFFNRINATRFNRKKIKRVEKAMAVVFFVIPIVLLVTDGSVAWKSILAGPAALQQMTSFASLYSVAAWTALLLLLPLWIVGRLGYWSQSKHESRIERQMIDAAKEVGPELFKPTWLKKLAKLPGNQIHLIEINTKRLTIDRLPQTWQDIRIAHLSDLHLTGWYDLRYQELAIEHLMQQKPDVLCLSGDLIDFDHCLDDTLTLLESLTCPLGCYFLLGNHDRRIRQIENLRARLVSAGWKDVGQETIERTVGTRVLQVFGNERPWFDHPHRQATEQVLLSGPRPANLLRIGISHSPDQRRWGQKCDCDLLLCGHTHGGQIRLPIVGPIISPSWDGSRFASGIFQMGTQTMHVSRGLSGTQPLRINCTPEVSILQLTSKTD